MLIEKIDEYVYILKKSYSALYLTYTITCSVVKNGLVNQWYKIAQGQSVTESEIPLQVILDIVYWDVIMMQGVLGQQVQSSILKGG